MWAIKVCILLSFVFILINALPVDRIVGGTDAPDGKYPYQVSVNVFFQHTCGGSIISDRFIITAAHCVFGVKLSLISVLAGTNKLKSGGVVYKISQTFIHNFDTTNVKNDIALLQTFEKIMFNELVQPIKLTYQDLRDDGHLVVATGWGKTSVNGNIPNNLQEVNLLIHGQDKCKNVWPIISEHHICTLTVSGKGVCMGDSGGPLVADGYLIGVVSFGEPCAVGLPDVYTRVYNYRDWIKNIIELNN